MTSHSFLRGDGRIATAVMSAPASLWCWQVRSVAGSSRKTGKGCMHSTRCGLSNWGRLVTHECGRPFGGRQLGTRSDTHQEGARYPQRCGPTATGSLRTCPSNPSHLLESQVVSVVTEAAYIAPFGLIRMQFSTRRSGGSVAVTTCRSTSKFPLSYLGGHLWGFREALGIGSTRFQWHAFLKAWTVEQARCWYEQEVRFMCTNLDTPSCCVTLYGRTGRCSRSHSASSVRVDQRDKGGWPASSSHEFGEPCSVPSAKIQRRCGYLCGHERLGRAG
jgi:hypothetical protein